MLQVDRLSNADIGDLRITMYTFEYAGDILPKHVHTENDVHVTIVARGKLRAYSHDWSIEASAGQMLNFRVGEPHELQALEDNTRIFNVVKKFGGISNDFNTAQGT